MSVSCSDALSVLLLPGAVLSRDTHSALSRPPGLRGSACICRFRRLLCSPHYCSLFLSYFSGSGLQFGSRDAVSHFYARPGSAQSIPSPVQIISPCSSFLSPELPGRIIMVYIIVTYCNHRCCISTQQPGSRCADIYNQDFPNIFLNSSLSPIFSSKYRCAFCFS